MPQLAGAHQISLAAIKEIPGLGLLWWRQSAALPAPA
jgi:hypothetical protein